MKYFSKIILALTLCHLGCGGFNDKVMFQRNIVDPVPESITNITMFKDRSAMHGALFFEFEANEVAVADIIKKNQLNQEGNIPEVIQSIISNAPWVDMIDFNSVKVYGKMIRGEYEWHALYLFVAKNKVYCMKV